MTASQQSASRVLLDIDQAARQALAVEPRLVLEGARPRLLDEWQVAPELWNQVRRAVDASEQPGQFLLTGSAVPAEDISRHTGAGRFGFLRMRPMSLFESGVSNGAVSLRQLFAGEVQTVADPGLSVQDLGALIARGGWPAQQSRPLKAASRAARDYLEQVRQIDISRVDRRRDPARVGALLRSLGRHCATEARLSTLAADVALDERTVTAYLQALEQLMVIEDQPAWAPHLRSRARLRKAPKRHFVDPSLALAASGAAAERLPEDFEWFGQLFESLVIRDLRVLSQPLEGEVLHYRDDYGVEADAIVQLCDGRWGAIEIKLGEGQVDEAAANLKRFSDQIDSQRSGSAAFLAVICSKGYGYRRPDGVVVVPVGALGP
ncbi:ATP-binding protein [Cyanobium sp. Tous-M-B4]|nr:ATP-binding protein [Cyanobium sp. Tous-M-B4]MCP9875260.1 ATP-binding protein [Cyanobium sp. A2C-AMD]